MTKEKRKTNAVYDGKLTKGKGVKSVQFIRHRLNGHHCEVGCTFRPIAFVLFLNRMQLINARFFSLKNKYHTCFILNRFSGVADK